MNNCNSNDKSTVRKLRKEQAYCDGHPKAFMGILVDYNTSDKVIQSPEFVIRKSKVIGAILACTNHCLVSVEMDLPLQLSPHSIMLWSSQLSCQKLDLLDPVHHVLNKRYNT